MLHNGTWADSSTESSKPCTVLQPTGQVPPKPEKPPAFPTGSFFWQQLRRQRTEKRQMSSGKRIHGPAEPDQKPGPGQMTVEEDVHLNFKKIFILIRLIIFIKNAMINVKSVVNQETKLITIVMNV